MAETITAAELKQRLDRQDQFLLVDVMPPSQYLLLHLPGAINVPLEYLHEVLEYLPQDQDIILYCTNEQCDFSRTAARKLELHGFSRVLVFEGGLAAWEQAGNLFATILLNPEDEAPASEPAPPENPESLPEDVTPAQA